MFLAFQQFYFIYKMFGVFSFWCKSVVLVLVFQYCVSLEYNFTSAILGSVFVSGCFWVGTTSGCDGFVNFLLWPTAWNLEEVSSGFMEFCCPETRHGPGIFDSEKKLNSRH